MFLSLGIEVDWEDTNFLCEDNTAKCVTSHPRQENICSAEATLSTPIKHQPLHNIA